MSKAMGFNLRFAFCLAALIGAFSSPAFASSSGVTYQGRIFKPDGTPLSGQFTQFKMQIRTPDTSCLMYEEIQSQDLRNTGGVFSLTINDGTGSRSDTTGLTLDRIFANRGTFNLDVSTCSTGTGVYSPAESDGRNLVVLFKDETMATWEPIPPQKINFVPYAFESKQIAGFTADSLLRVVNGSGDPLTGLAPLSNAQYTALMDLVNGSSSAYTKAGQLNGVALPTMTTGEVLGWNGTTWVSQAATGGPNSVTTTMIQNGAVDGTKLDPAISISTSGMIASAVTTTRDFKIYAAAPSNFYVGMLADPALAASYTLTWPLNAGSANQVLTTDGSGKLTWETPSSAGITALTGEVTATGPGSAAATVVSVGGVTAANVASGATAANDATALNTPNTIVKRDGSGGFAAGDITAAAVKTDSLQLNNAGSVVNIVNPTGAAYTLTLPTGPGTSGQVLTANGLGVTSWTNPLTNSTAFVQGGNTFGANADLGTNDAFDLNLRTAGTTKVTVTSGGKVGIGTTSPSSPLHITSATAAQTLAVQRSNNTTGAATIAYWPAGVNGPSNVTWISGMPINSNDYRIVSTPDAGSTFSYPFNITNTGNVGIGTTAPEKNLHIQGADQNVNLLVENTSSTGSKFPSTSLVNFGSSADSWPLVNFKNSNGSKASPTAIGSATWLGAVTFQGAADATPTWVQAATIVGASEGALSSTSAPGKLMFLTTESGSVTPTERMRIASGGNVGIGTTSPVTKLEVAGSFRVGDGGETCDASLTGAIRYNGGNLQFCAGVMPWSTLGTAGSGLTALTGDVTASGTGSVPATVASVGGVTAANVASGANAANAATDANTPSTIVKRDGSGGFSAGAVSVTSLTATGAVTQGSAVFKDSGSNTVTVQAPATVSPSYTLTLPTSAGGSDQILKTDSLGQLSWTSFPTALPPNGTAGGDLTGSYPNPTVATVGGSTAALVNSAELLANAATPSNSPDTIVRRNGLGSFTANVVTLNGVALNNAGSVVNIINPTGAAYTLTLPTGPGTSGQVLTADGAGVTSWTTPLTGTTGFVQGGNTFGANADLGTNDSFDLNLRTAGTTKMTVTSGGNVGIGTTAPDYKFVVSDSDYQFGIQNGSEVWGLTNWGSNLLFQYNSGGGPENKMQLTSDGSLQLGQGSDALDLIALGGDQVNAGANFQVAGSSAEPYLAGTRARGTWDAPTAVDANDVLFDLLAAGYDGADYSNQVAMKFRSSQTWTAGAKGTDILFQTTANNTTALSDAMLISNSGHVGIGTTSPNGNLDVKGSIVMSGATSGFTGFQPSAAAGSTIWTLPSADGGAGQVLKTDGSGNLGWVTPVGAGVTSVTSANTDIGVANTTTTPVLTLNSGTGPDQILKLDGSSKIPAVDGSQITNLNASSFTSGTLPVSRGGTGATSFAPLSAIAADASGNQVAVPGSTSNTMLQWDVTGPKWSAAVWPSATTANKLLYSSANNVVGQLATSNNGVLVTDGSGVPSIGSSLPSAVQGNITSVGTIASGTWNGSAIGAGYGGTGQTSFTVGDLLYANSASTLAKLPAAASGYVLTSNGAGTAPSWQAAASGMGGSGTANYLPKFTAGTTLGNSAIYEAGGKVGIGTTAPTGTLEVQGGVAPADTAGSPITIKAQDATGPSGHVGGEIFLTAGEGAGGWSGGSVYVNATQGQAGGLEVNNGHTSGYVPTSASANFPSGRVLTVNNAWAVNNNTAMVLMNVLNSSSRDQFAYLGPVSVAGSGVYSPDFVFGRSTGSSSYAESMRIAGATGNVGIGTTSPSQALHVLSSGTASAIIENTSSGTGSLFAPVVVANRKSAAGDGVGVAFSMLDGPGGNTFEYGYVGARIEAANSQGSLHFHTKAFGTDNSVMRIGPDQVVNIGKEVFQWPTIRTDVTGYSVNANNIVNIMSSSTSDGAAKGVLSLGSSKTVAATGDQLGSLDFLSKGNGSAITHKIGSSFIGGLEGAGGANGFGGNLQFVTKADNGVLSERMRINSSGNVGIGTTSSAATLHVSNTASANAIFHTRSNGQEPQVSIRRSRTGSPDSALLINDIVGYLDFSGYTGSAYSPGARIGAIAMENFSGGAVGSSLVFQTTSMSTSTISERMRINGYGNVGIGTTSPGYKLDVNGIANATQLCIAGDCKSAWPSGGGLPAANGTAAAPSISFTGDTNTGLYHPTGDSIAVSTNGNEVLRVDSTGSVGIGTSNPLGKLHVMGDILTSNSINIGNAEAGSMLGFSDWTDYVAGDSDYHYVKIGTNNNERIRVISNGNVGIGTTSPTYMLDVAGTGRFNSSVTSGTTGTPGGLYLARSSDGASTIQFINSSNEGRFTSNGGAGFFSWYTNNGSTTEKMRLDNNGNVGIGTTSPTQTLEVNGTVLASAYLYSSDRRLKKDITPLEQSLDKLLTLNTVKFNWITPHNSDEERTQIGLIAQDVQKVFPEAVKEDSQGWLRMNYQALISPIIDGMREIYQKVLGIDKRTKVLETEVAALKAENAQMKSDNKKLEERLNQIEQALSRQPAGH